MKDKLLSVITLLLYISGLHLGTTSLNAHPVIWKSGNAVLLNYDSFQSSITYHHSLSYKWSLGARYLQLDKGNAGYTFGQSNWLLKRWYGRGYQGNVYALTSLGYSDAEEETNPIIHLGAQADWETRQVYTLFQANYYSFDTPTLLLRGRVGFAPYVGDFNDTHTWLMLQVDDVMQGDNHSLAVLPVIRFFKNNVLIEFGSNFSGKSMVTTMLHF